MDDKKNLLICAGLFLVSLLLGLGCYYFTSLFVEDNDFGVVDNDNNNEEDSVDINENDNNQNVVDDDLTTGLEKITLNDDEYLWEMVVINPDGAYVYESTNNTVISKLEYGTRISIFGDYVDIRVLNVDGVDYDDFTLDDIKDYYYVIISYSVSEGKNQIGYVKYNDVSLIDADNYNSLEYDDIKKYYVSNNETYLYDGPGLLFEKENSIVIPEGEILEVKYYNQIFSRNWLYITYKNYSGFVMGCRYHSVNEPYSIVINNCVDEIISESSKLKINQDNVFLYKDAAGEEKVSVIVSGSEINYDYKINSEPGIIKFHTNYNGIDGFLFGVEINEDDCGNLDDDGKLYIISQRDGNIKTCD